VLSLREILANPQSRDVAWLRLRDHLVTFAYRNPGIGRLVAHLIGRRGRGPATDEKGLAKPPACRPPGKRPDGSAAPHAAGFPRPQRQERWRRNLAAYPQRVERARLARGWDCLIGSHVPILQAIDATVMLAMPPAPNPQSCAARRLLRDRHPGYPVLHPDPLAQPDLYDPRLWYDRGHLNARGAELLLRRLAEAACREVGSVEPGGPTTVADGH
jgi:hypothetical protein